MTARQTKILTLLFALLNVWLVCHIPAVSDALLKFVSVGLVPGTNTTLSPNTMLYLAVGVFAVCVLLLFWRQIRRLFVRRSAVDEGSTTPEHTVHSVPLTPNKPKVHVVRPQIVHATRMRLLPMVQAVTARIQSAGKQIFRRARTLVAWGSAEVRRAAIWARLTIMLFWRWLLPRTKQAWAVLCRVAKVFWLLTIDAWHWLEPHIRAFDHWLEARMHSNPAMARSLHWGGRVMAGLRRNVRYLRQLLRRLIAAVRKAWQSACQADGTDQADS